ncbi:hypothetical protein MBLNU457_g1018t1 [Dothideomycetes sp. NU457]
MGDDKENVGVMRTMHKTNRSFYMHSLHALIKPFKPKLVSSSEVYPPGSQRLTPHGRARKLCDISERQASGIYVYDMQAKSSNASGTAKITRRIYYFAGGGWKAPPSPQHWKFCAEICEKLSDTAVTVVSCPLAPHCPAATTMPILERFCSTEVKESRARDESVVLGGDSSGGNLVLCLALQILEHHVDVPSITLLTISPAVDLQQMRDEGIYAETNRNDPVLTVGSHNEEVALWAGDSDAAQAWISPINGDVALLAQGTVRLIAVTGAYDVLTPDALRFKAKCEAAGVMGDWLHWEKQMHCFPLAFVYGLPESVQSKDWIIDRLREV